MKQIRRFIFTIVLGGVAISACSTKKNAFLNRNWHALNTKYNVLYNGNIAFEEGREQLNTNYRDDYWEVLPVERMQVTDEVKLDSEDNNPKFVIAEEKATKAIQKHSMDIKNVERNPQTDEAFLLLGKARYFDQRFIPAMEAFNYILRKYQQSDKLSEARIWREKTNVRLENEELAIENLKFLNKYDDLSDQEYADSHAVLAQAYINLGIADTAVQELKIASAYTKKKPEKGRYYFIIGQLFDQMGYKDSANIAYNKVIDLNRQSPRVYMINAELKKLQNIGVTAANKEEVLKKLKDMEKNRENRPFLNKIYRELAHYYADEQQDSLSLAYYNRSLRATQDLPKLNALNYEDLANYYFDGHQYKTSGAYYDSVLRNSQENSRQYRTVKKKLDNLEEVIGYETTVQYADSVLNLYKMSPAQRDAYFETYVADLKKKDEAAAKKEEERTTKGIVAFGETKGGKENKGKFYFYNITSLGYGKNEFRTRWGDRKLEDNWRWATKGGSTAGSDEILAVGQPVQNTDGPTQDQKYNVAYYTAQIPTDSKVVDSLATERNFANYQLGLIYKEKFHEDQLAAEKLEDVLRSDPEERLILPSKYNLYKIYEAAGSPLAAQMKQDIINNHPDSRYAEILVNPRAVLEGDANGPEAQYARLYKMYEQQQFLQVITQSEEVMARFTGDPIVPKLEMLKATAIGRLQGLEDFKEALNYVALNYPNSAEGKKAEEMLQDQVPKLEPKDFVETTSNNGNWKLVFPFKVRDDQAATALQEKLLKSIEDLHYHNKVSKDMYDLEDEFVVVHGFTSHDRALGYAELLKNNKDYRVDRENFVILSDNYQIVQVHKNLQDYLKQL